MKKLLAILSAFALMGFVSIMPDATGYKPGDYVMDFKLKNIDGKMFSLTDLKKEKGAIVIFTCNHCPYSVAYEDRIIALHKKYASQGFPVVAINPNDPQIVPGDSYENMQKRAKEKEFPFAYLVDETQDIAKTYGAKKTPHVFLLVRENDKFKVAYIGGIDDNSQVPEEVKNKYLENAVDAALAGKEPNPNTTKALGCSVKYRAAK